MFKTQKMLELVFKRQPSALYMSNDDVDILHASSYPLWLIDLIFVMISEKMKFSIWGSTDTFSKKLQPSITYTTIYKRFISVYMNNDVNNPHFISFRYVFLSYIYQYINRPNMILFCCVFSCFWLIYYTNIIVICIFVNMNLI